MRDNDVGYIEGLVVGVIIGIVVGFMSGKYIMFNRAVSCLAGETCQLSVEQVRKLEGGE